MTQKMKYQLCKVLDAVIIFLTAATLIFGFSGGFKTSIIGINISFTSIGGIILLLNILILIRLAAYIFRIRPPFLFSDKIHVLKEKSEISTIYLGIFFTSASALMLEILLTRIFSVTLFYHFAFMAISVALFGGAISGVVVYIFRKFFTPAHARRHLTISMILMAASAILSTLIILSMTVGNNYSPVNVKKMALIYILTAVPFFFGGLTITLSLTHFAGNISRVYFSDLIGASLGCFLIIPLLNIIPAPSAIFFVAFLALLAASMFNGRVNKRMTVLMVVLIAAVYLFIPFNSAFNVVKIRSQKGQELDYSKVLFEKWNSFSRIAVYDQYHKDWSLSHKYTGKVIDSLYMDIDALASTPIIHYKGNIEDISYISWELSYSGFVINPNPKVFIIGPGGGRDLAAALVAGAREIDAAEINQIIVKDVMLGKYRDYCGDLYSHHAIDIHLNDARSYIRASDEKYDVILASLVDTWAASSAGAFNLVENNLYTVEAFADFYNHLSDNGILSIERWNSETPRLFSVAREMAKRIGLENYQNNVIVIAHQNGSNFLLKKTPWQPHEVAKINEWASERQFWVMYDPYSQGDNIYYNILKSANNLDKKIIERYIYDLSPVTDNRPFFFLKEKNIGFGKLIKQGLEKKTLLSGKMMFNRGTSSLQYLILIIIILVLFVILIPMITFKSGELKKHFTSKFLALLYFGVLGAGFMLIEVAMMQKFILFLGHPIYSLSVVLFTVLIFGGLGSRFTARWEEKQAAQKIKIIIPILAIISLFYLLILNSLLYGIFTLPVILRIIITVLLLAPLAFTMGMPLPLGIKYINSRFKQIIPWSWAVNGSLSVLGSAFAFYIAITKGYNRVLLTGLIFYLAGLLISFSFRNEKADQK